jgi:MFS family permease
VSLFILSLFKRLDPFPVTSLAAGRVGDIIGRRGTLFIGAIVFTIGGAIQTFTRGYIVMIVGRIVSGFGVGLLSYVSCVRAF